MVLGLNKHEHLRLDKRTRMHCTIFPGDSVCSIITNQ